MVECSSSTGLLCLGEPLVEFNQQTDGSFLPGFGSDVSNVAISLARQGARTGLLARVGGDQFGGALRQLWQTEGVNDEHIRTVATGETGLYFVTHHEDGHQFTYRRRRSAASEYETSDLPEEGLKGCRMFYASGISLAVSETMRAAVVEAARTSRANGGLFAFDPNLRTKLWPLEQAKQATHSTMEICDIALPSLEDERQIIYVGSPEDIVKFYHSLGASEVILTLGREGVVASDGSERNVIASENVQALDATGDGDCFNGAYLAGRLRGQSVFEAAAWANVAAALSTRGLGAVAPIPTSKETKAYRADTGEKQ